MYHYDCDKHGIQIRKSLWDGCPVCAEDKVKSYFGGYSDPYQQHPHMPSTGSEGRCDLCGGYHDALVHQ